MEIPKIEDIKDNIIWIFTFFIVGYFALYSLFEPYFLNYDILTRIILSMVASYILFIPSTLLEYMSFTLFFKTPIKKDYIPPNIESLHTITGNIALFGGVKILSINNTFGYNSIDPLIIIFVIIFVCEPMIGFATGVLVSARESNK